MIYVKTCAYLFELVKLKALSKKIDAKLGQEYFYCSNKASKTL